MATPLRSVSRKARAVKAAPVAPSCDYAIPAPPASVRRVKAAPPVVVFVHVLSQGRYYVTFSGVESGDTVRVTYSATGYKRLLPKGEARAHYADLLSRGYRDPTSLFARAS